jgi:hypothetical protein
MDYLEKNLFCLTNKSEDLYLMRCPFQEKYPRTAFVHVPTDTFFCHSCGIGGSMQGVRTRLVSEKKTTLEKWRKT